MQILVGEDEDLLQALGDGALTGGELETEIIASGEEAVTSLEGAPARYCMLLTGIHLKG